mmetsp:Transcript_16196/g.32794  ORF Transcript_16196/g.32794 Transcript_16196/m.32794 type:complete len:400 (+) Transcript_16196:216-1415(+)
MELSKLVLRNTAPTCAWTVKAKHFIIPKLNQTQRSIDHANNERQADLSDLSRSIGKALRPQMGRRQACMRPHGAHACLKGLRATQKSLNLQPLPSTLTFFCFPFSLLRGGTASQGREETSEGFSIKSGHSARLYSHTRIARHPQLLTQALCQLLKPHRSPPIPLYLTHKQHDSQDGQVPFLFLCPLSELLQNQFEEGAIIRPSRRVQQRHALMRPLRETLHLPPHQSSEKGDKRSDTDACHQKDHMPRHLPLRPQLTGDVIYQRRELPRKSQKLNFWGHSLARSGPALLHVLCTRLDDSSWQLVVQPGGRHPPLLPLDGDLEPPVLVEPGGGGGDGPGPLDEAAGTCNCRPPLSFFFFFCLLVGSRPARQLHPHMLSGEKRHRPGPWNGCELKFERLHV